MLYIYIILVHIDELKVDEKMEKDSEAGGNVDKSTSHPIPVFHLLKKQ